jgi:hypothetical protein
VAVDDAQGYAPYAVDGCRVAYVDAATGALVLRDLAAGTKVDVAAKTEAPRRPSLRDDVLTWEATLGGVPSVRVRSSGNVSTISGAFHHAREPRAAVDAVVFTGWSSADEKGDTDVYVFHTATGAVDVAGGGAGQQRFADISASHVAYSDFSEDPDLTYDEDGADLADVVLVDRSSGTATPRKRAGKQAFPLLGSAGNVVYMEWEGLHPEPKFEAFGLRAFAIDAPATDVFLADVLDALRFLRPTTAGGLVAWSESSLSGDVLRHLSLSSPGTVEAVTSLTGLSLTVPAVTPGLILVGAKATGSSTYELRATGL